MRILLCVTDEDNRAFLADALSEDIGEETGNTVTAVADGSGAVTHAGCTYDLLLIEYSGYVSAELVIRHFRDQGVKTPAIALLESERTDWQKAIGKFDKAAVVVMPFGMRQLVEAASGLGLELNI